MPISTEVIQAKEFCESLSSEQLDIICRLNFSKPKAKNNPSDPDVRILSDEDYLLALEWQYHAQIELIGRLEYGFNETATDKWEAHDLRKKAKEIRKDAKKLREANAQLNALPAWENDWYHVIDDIHEPKNTANTQAIKSIASVKSITRLLLPRLNRPIGYIVGFFTAADKKPTDFLPRWFTFLSLENLFEAVYDLIVLIKTFFKSARNPKNINAYANLNADQKAQVDNLRAKADKVGRGERLAAKSFKGTRPTRMTNAIVWLTINGTGIGFLIMSLVLGVGLSSIMFAIPVLNVVVAASLISAALALSGTVFDLIVDVAGSLYELFNLQSLFGKINTKLKKPEDTADKSANFLNKNISRFTVSELAIKREESLVTRMIRSFTTDVAFSISMLLISAGTLGIVIPPLYAVILLSAVATLALADLIPTLTLANNQFNNIDKVRSAAVFIGLVACVAFAVAMFFGAPFFSLFFIGGFMAAAIAIPSLARRYARLDKDAAIQTLIGWKDGIVNLAKRVAKGIVSIFTGKAPDDKIADEPLAQTSEVTPPNPSIKNVPDQPTTHAVTAPVLRKFNSSDNLLSTQPAKTAPAVPKLNISTPLNSDGQISIPQKLTTTKDFLEAKKILDQTFKSRNSPGQHSSSSSRKLTSPVLTRNVSKAFDDFDLHSSTSSLTDEKDTMPRPTESHKSRARAISQLCKSSLYGKPAMNVSTTNDESPRKLQELVK